MKRQYRHGEVLLTPAEIPKGAKKQKCESVIFLSNEGSRGRAHAVMTDKRGCFPSSFVHGGLIYLRVPSGCFVAHLDSDMKVQEDLHDSFGIAAGNYEVRLQSPFHLEVTFLRPVEKETYITHYTPYTYGTYGIEYGTPISESHERVVQGGCYTYETNGVAYSPPFYTPNERKVLSEVYGKMVEDFVHCKLKKWRDVSPYSDSAFRVGKGRTCQDSYGRMTDLSVRFMVGGPNSGHPYLRSCVLFVQATKGKRMFMHAILPEFGCEKIVSAHQAAASTFGLLRKDYAPEKES